MLGIQETCPVTCVVHNSIVLSYAVLKLLCEKVVFSFKTTLTWTCCPTLGCSPYTFRRKTTMSMKGSTTTSLHQLTYRHNDKHG